MGVLDNPGRIKGIKLIKSKPDPREFLFDKSQPLSPFNFPLTKTTLYKIFGYRIDKVSGIKRPFWLKKRVPTGTPLRPQMCGLDGFFQVEPILEHPLSPQEEKKLIKKDYE